MATIAVYRPPSLEVATFLELLNDYLQILMENIEVNIGDTNINILFSDTYTENSLNLISEYGFKSSINNFIRIEGPISNVR